MSLVPTTDGDVEQLQGGEVSNADTMDTVIAKPKHESSSTPGDDGDLQHHEDRDDPMFDIVQQAQNQATRRGLTESLGLDSITSENACSSDFDQQVNNGTIQLLSATASY